MLNILDIKLMENTFAFWDKITDYEKDLIIKNATKKSYKKNKHIYSGEQDCFGITIVKSGQIRVYLLSEEGKEITLYRLYPGDICSLSASCLIKNITFEVHIDAECNSEILVIDLPLFSKLAKENIYVQNFLYKTTIDRFSDVMEAITQILFLNIDQRLAKFLVDETIKNNSSIITLTHEQIAKYIGSAREVVSRRLKYFSNEKLISITRGEVKVIDADRLSNTFKI